MAEFKVHMHRYLGNGKFAKDSKSECGRKVSNGFRTTIMDFKSFKQILNSEDKIYICINCLKSAYKNELIK